jgi:pimeloyl-ACP methyl ester carboxylesterase
VPTTVIAGKYDLQARPAAQQALAQSLPYARFHLFDARHGVLFSDTEATVCAYQAIQRAATL